MGSLNTFGVYLFVRYTAAPTGKPSSLFQNMDSDAKLYAEDESIDWFIKCAQSDQIKCLRGLSIIVFMNFGTILAENIRLENTVNEMKYGEG